MPQKSYPYPFEQRHRVETARPLTEEQLIPLVKRDVAGITLEIVIPGVGAGYLFHIEESEGGYKLRSYKGDPLPALNFANIESLTRFINHASGLRFDPEAWRLSEELNRKIAPDKPQNGTTD